MSERRDDLAAARARAYNVTTAIAGLCIVVGVLGHKSLPSTLSHLLFYLGTFALVIAHVAFLRLRGESGATKLDYQVLNELGTLKPGAFGRPEMAAWIIGIAVILVSAIGVIQSSRADTRFPMALDSTYFPSGWMGDGLEGRKYFSLTNVTAEVQGATRIAVRVDYQTGPKGWAGVYWQHPDGNWGTQRGLNLSGAREITFLSRGEHGREIVEFKAGGIPGTFSDSFERSLGKVVLSKSWQAYRIDIAEENLSNVIGVFACVAPAPFDGRVTFYIADLTVR